MLIVQNDLFLLSSFLVQPVHLITCCTVSFSIQCSGYCRAVASVRRGGQIPPLNFKSSYGPVIVVL